MLLKGLRGDQAWTILLGGTYEERGKRFLGKLGKRREYFGIVWKQILYVKT